MYGCPHNANEILIYDSASDELWGEWLGDTSWTETYKWWGMAAVDDVLSEGRGQAHYLV